MELLNVFKNYFNGFREIYNYNSNDHKTNVLAILKIISYVAEVIVLGCAAVYGAASLCGRASTKQDLSSHDNKVKAQATTALGSNQPTNPVSVDSSKSVGSPKIGLSEVLTVYWNAFKPEQNRENLEEYSRSPDYRRHAATARIYYNSSQLSEEDALRIIYQREPTNMRMGPDQYNRENLNKLFGYKESAYNDKNAKKEDGSLFKELPNTAAVYSETSIWYPPGGKNTKEIACLSLPAPALDTKYQPHYQYYVNAGELDADKYEKEMVFLFNVIEKAARDHKNTAFNNKGIQRLVLSRFGQGAFLSALSQKNQETAHNAYKNQMAIFLDNIKDLNLSVVMSEYKHPHPNDVWHNEMIIGDIIETAEEGDLIINPWDPHSAPGNGNDADPSFDGAMGKASGILLTQTSWLNEHLKSKNSLVPV